MKYIAGRVDLFIRDSGFQGSFWSLPQDISGYFVIWNTRQPVGLLNFANLRKSCQTPYLSRRYYADCCVLLLLNRSSRKYWVPYHTRRESD
jgi:hypothetical protein